MVEWVKPVSPPCQWHYGQARGHGGSAAPLWNGARQLSGSNLCLRPVSGGTSREGGTVTQWLRGSNLCLRSISGTATIEVGTVAQWSRSGNSARKQSVPAVQISVSVAPVWRIQGWTHGGSVVPAKRMLFTGSDPGDLRRVVVPRGEHSFRATTRHKS